MKRRDFLKNVAAGTVAVTVSPRIFGAENVKKGKILYFDLSTEWEHPPTVDEADGTSYAGKIVRTLGEKLGYDVELSKDGTIFDGDLSGYSAFVFYTCGDLDKAPEGKKGVSKAGEQNLYNAIRGGIGFLGIHSATDTWQCAGELFKNQPESERTEYIHMIGGDFITHGEIQEATLKITEPVELPTLKKIGAPTLRFTEEWYTMKNFNHDMHVLLVQETDGMKQTDRNACYQRPPYPSTWVRMEGKGRVAYTAFGHDNQKWDQPLVQGVVSDLMSFVTGGLDLDITPNFDKVCSKGDTLPNL